MATTYLTPGVYIEEVPSGPQPIAGASTNVMAIVGSTDKGPLNRAERVSSWNEFVATFGASTGLSYTAAALFGFFENGGPAAWVVRTNLAAPTTWEVKTADNNTVLFNLEAFSPGTWGDALTPTVRLDLVGGGGSLFSSAITQVAADGANSRVTVGSTAGLAVGETVVLVSPAGPTAAVVAGVTDTTIEFATNEVNALNPPPTHVAARVANNATSVKLAVVNGLRPNDIVEANLPDGARASGRITAIAADGRGATLTLAAGIPGPIDAVGMATRTHVARGTIAVGGASVPVASIIWVDGFSRTKEDIGVQHVATAANGARGRRANAAANNIGFTPAATAGRVTVETLLKAAVFAESGIAFQPANLAAIAERYAFVPVGAKLRFVDGANNSTVTRTVNGFSQDPGTDVTTLAWADVALVLDDVMTTLVVRCPADIVVGDSLQIAAAGAPVGVTASVSHGAGVHVVTLAAAGIATAAVARTSFEVKAIVATTFAPVRFALDITGPTGETEHFGGLSLSAGSPTFVAKEGVVNAVSTLVKVTGNPPEPTALSGLPAVVAVQQLGSLAPPTANSLADGFDALETVSEPAVVICPDALLVGDSLATAAVIDAMVSHCERFRRYAIVDTPNITKDSDLLAWRSEMVASTQAGVYAPHVEILNLDPAGTTRTVLVPPSGFVAGVFARTDNERGVWKAPANERVRGIVGLAKDFTDRHQDLLNPGGVNLIRAFPNRGRRIWGARNATDDVQWRYVNVRRLFNFMETSIERSTQWVVFEPNTASTWLRVRVSVEDFLDQIWRGGGLAGATPKEAYRVRVGLGETMTEADIDLGLVIIEVAVAPAKPAEFVVFRFSHKRQRD